MRLTRGSSQTIVSFILAWINVQALTPSMTAQEVVEHQLAALKKDDMREVIKYASPNNLARMASFERFSNMVRSGPYRYLVRHEWAEIVLTVSSAKDERWRGLVRAYCCDENSENNSKELAEYWWLLSRCDKGDHIGCFMVDSVIPNS